MRKTLTLVVALLMTAQLLVACGNTPSDSTDTTVPTDPTSTTAAPETTLPPETKPPKPEIPAIDGKGSNFSIIARKQDGSFPNSEFLVHAELTGDTMNEAVAKRNRIIEEKYKVKIVTTEAATADVRTELQKQVAAKDQTYDIALPTIRNAFLVGLEGAFYNVKDIPYVSPNSPWYDQTMMSNFTVGGNIYMMLSDMNLQNFNSIATVYYNHKVGEKSQIPNVYQDVLDGKWTIDLMHQYCKNATVDTNGDQVLGPGDQWGLVSGAYAWQSMFYGSGETFTIKDNMDMPKLNWNTARNIDIITKMTELLNDLDCAVVGKHRTGFKSTVSAFTSDEALFMVEYIYNMPSVRKMESEFGLLPPPKYDEKQEKYYTALHTSHSSATVVPVTNTRMELTGAILEDLAYQSQEIIRPAFYDITLTGKYVRNEESVQMLNLIYANINTDLTLGMATSGFTIDKVMRAIYDEYKNEFVSAIAAENDANAQIMQTNAEKILSMEKK